MRRILAALVASAAVSTAAPAGAVTFDFSFTNAFYGGGLVEGTVSGLVNNATSPGNVVVTSNAGGFGVGAYNGNEENSFTVANGAMINLVYTSFGQSNPDPTTCCSLTLTSGTGGGLSNVPNAVTHSPASAVTFTLVDEPAPIPLPAPFALLAAGIALLVGVARRGRRARA
jgi:hypothetical protein